MYTQFGRRYISFDSMPSKGQMNIFMMALCGLFYQCSAFCTCYFITSNNFFKADGQISSMVKCAFCTLWLEHFDATPDWCLTHAKRSPKCIHLLATFGVEKIIRLRRNANVDNTTIHLLKQNLFEHGIKPMIDDETRTGGNHVSTYTTASGTKFSQPAKKAMTAFSSRRSTFHSMPETFRRMENSDHFAEAGFYFDVNLVSDGKNFPLRCYYCDIVIRYNIDRVWNYRDPWRAHISVNRHCFHNILMKGEDFTLTDVQGYDGEFLCEQNGQERNSAGRKTCFSCRRNVDQSHVFVHLCCDISVCNKCTTPNPCPNCHGNLDGRKTCFSCRRSVVQSHVCVHLCCDISVCNECSTGGPCPNCNGENE